MEHLNSNYYFFQKNLFRRTFCPQLYLASSIVDFNENKDNVLFTSKKNLLLPKIYRGSIVVYFLDSMLYLEDKRVLIEDSIDTLEIKPKAILKRINKKKLISEKKKMIVIGYNPDNKRANIWLDNIIDFDIENVEKKNFLENCLNF